MPENSEQNPSTIGKKLWDARKERKMSLRELAKASEISASMLSQIETGKAFPSVRSLYKIAGALDVSLDYFFPAQQSLAQPEPELVTASRLTASQMREAMVSNSADGNLGFGAMETSSAPIVHSNTRPMIELNSGITWARLTAQPEPETEFLEIRYAPEAKSGNTMSSHDGREFGLVLEGELLVELGFESHSLRAGDSIIFDSSTPHRLSNNGHQVMRALWVVLNQKQP
jgi:transcriptional regulator with XRE-family HTH domain/quercetin dioxygenase-like cupin family protein